MAIREPSLSRLQRLTYRVWFAVGVVVLAAVSLWLLYRPLAVILAPVLLALLLVYLLNPLVSWLEQRRVPRLLGTGLAYLGVGGALAGLTAFFHKSAGRLTFPRLSWQFNAEASTITLTLHSDPKPQAVRAWIASAPRTIRGPRSRGSAPTR
jgi:predicted PurR-regulated permease PerM